MLIDARSIWTKVKAFGSKVTSVMSSLLSVLSTQWSKFAALWKTWTIGSKEIAVGLMLVAGLIVWHWSIDVTRFIGRGFTYSRNYVRGDSVSKAEMAAEIAKLPKAADVARLQDEIETLAGSLQSIDDKLDQAQGAKITTGSLPAKKPAKHPVAKKSSFSVSDPSTWIQP